MGNILDNGRWKNVASVAVVTLFLVSLPFKLATVHVAGVFLVLAALGLRRTDFAVGEAARLLLLTSLAWLIPVLFAGLLHELAATPSAAAFSETAKVWARILGVGLGLVFLLQRGRVSLHAIFAGAALAIALVAASGYYEWFMLWREGGWPSWEGHRIMGAVFSPNPFGFLMAMGIVLGLGLLRAQVGGVWSLLLVSVCLPVLWASGSRGGMIAAVFGLISFFSIGKRRHWWALFGLVGLLVLAYGAGWFDFQRASSDGTRRAILNFALMKWGEAPWFGWGIGALTVLDGHVDGQAAHNVLVDLGASCGVFAVVGWLYATGRMLVGLWGNEHPGARGVLAVLVVVLVAGLVDYSLLTAMIYQGVWMLVSVLACWIAARGVRVRELQT